MDQWISESRGQWTNGSMNHQWLIKNWMNQRTKESMKHGMNKSMNQWFNDSVSQWTNEPLHQWTKEPLNQCMLPTSSATSAPTPFFCVFEIWSKLFDMQIELSLRSGTLFADLIFQKCSEHECFFNIAKCKLSSLYSPVGFLSIASPDRSAERQKQRP